MKYRRYRRMTEEEQRAKFGFSQLDLMKKGEWLLPPYNEMFEIQSLISEDLDYKDLTEEEKETLKS